ncbi:hypothetical protein SS50377_23494 [Spironucleus salmonicida]|uniref:Uncharacterized protein n=1 Tax=Spironucleus salmonicida TaxID=348837 RepID=V6LRB6_9EUKA|nr:hypothetical protein SS50377_23494 [Spironucleus salmonicida]|eukprot:EST46231.1 hypothetical protein SS50377_13827 [Spironucleus salmonicida]
MENPEVQENNENTNQQEIQSIEQLENNEIIEQIHENEEDLYEQEQNSTYQEKTRQKIISNGKQLNRQEISYALSYFTTNYGFTNPYNTVTPQLFKSRFDPIKCLSYNSCFQLLREPFGTKKAPNKIVSGQDVIQILNYRTSAADTVDFAAESFLMLGAKDLSDKISLKKMAEIVNICYQDLELHLQLAEDYHEHLNYINKNLQENEKLRAERDGDSQQKMPKPEMDLEIGGVVECIEVLQLALGKDEIGFDEWKELFYDVLNLQFQDYRKDIQRAK